MTRPNKLEYLSLPTLSSQVLYLWVKAGRNKRSSLFGLVVNDDDEKKFNDIDTRGQSYKTFYSCNLPPFHGHTIILCYKTLLLQ
jgi:hypothetical protein